METLELFRNVAKTPSSTSKGAVELPILYRDATQVGMLFRVDLARANALLEDTVLEPWPIFGKALAAIYAWEYRDTDIGRYNEVGLGIQCRLRGSTPSLLRYGRDPTAQPEQAIWVVTLPVTTEAAYVAGAEVWGYPKYIAPIEANIEKKRASFALDRELELSVGDPRGPSLTLPIATFSQRNGELIRTVITVGHKVRLGRASTGSLELRGDGPTAEAARKLGVSNETAIACFRTDAFKAVLPKGEPAGPLHLDDEEAKH
jgi:hypothetical protein